MDRLHPKAPCLMKRDVHEEPPVALTDDGSDGAPKNGFRFYRQIYRCHGWQARFTLKGVRYTRYFSDAAYGSAESARRAAEEFAAQNGNLHRELLALGRRFEVRRNCRSGIPRVSKYEGWGHGPYWLAYWHDESGRRVSRRFSISRLGDAKALECAVKARKQGVHHFQERYKQLLSTLHLQAELTESEKRGSGR